MACDGCKKAIFEQFKNYPGRWICFHIGPKIGSVICHTPAEDYDNVEAHNRVLSEATLPKWCPKLQENKKA